MTENARLDRIKDKIRKLLRLGNDPGAFEGEIRNALAAAQALMDEHHLHEGELGDHPTDGERMEHSSIYSNGSGLTSWEMSLVHAVVHAVGTIGWYYMSPTVRRSELGLAVLKNGRPEKAVPLFFYGPQEDVELAKELFREMSLTIMAMARLKFGGVFRGEGRSYCEGFARQLADQARHDSGQRSTECKAIVLKKAEKAERWLREECGIRVTTRSRCGYGYGDFDAYEEGRRDGGQTGISVTRRGKLAGEGGGALPAP